MKKSTVFFLMAATAGVSIALYKKYEEHQLEKAAEDPANSFWANSKLVMLSAKELQNQLRTIAQPTFRELQQSLNKKLPVINSEVEDIKASVDNLSKNVNK